MFTRAVAVLNWLALTGGAVGRSQISEAASELAPFTRLGLKQFAVILLNN